MFISFKQISQEQRKPLEYKEQKAIEAIRQGFSVNKHKTAVAFSGGKDSTVLWHLIRTNFPEKTPEIIFGNTGVEYPESLKFARELGQEWGKEHFHETKLECTTEEGLKYEAQREVLDWLINTGQVGAVLKKDGKLKSTLALERAATSEMWQSFKERNLVWRKGTPKSYWWCVDQYGFPIMGKAASKLDARRINIDCFLRFSQSISAKEDLLKYYDILRECRFSQHCCKLLKKDPSERMQAKLDVDVIFKGLMAAESRTRLTNFSTRGYLFKSSRTHLENDSFYHCNPISIWTDSDIWAYIHKYDVPYSPLYDMGYIDNKGVEHKIQRNGCFGCATDILFKNNHMSMLRQTHKKLWDAVMNYGMANELKKLTTLRSNGYPTIVNLLEADALLETRPCAFDDMEKVIDTTGIKEEYDSEA